MGLKGPIFGPYWAQSKTNIWCSVTFSKSFTGFTTVLLHMLIPSTFRCLENMGLRGPIFGPLWAPQIDHNSGHFIKYFPMVSHHSRFLCLLLGVLLCVFQLCAPKALFLGLELSLQRSLLGLLYRKGD